MEPRLSAPESTPSPEGVRPALAPTPILPLTNINRRLTPPNTQPQPPCPSHYPRGLLHLFERFANCADCFGTANSQKYQPYQERRMVVVPGCSRCATSAERKRKSRSHMESRRYTHRKWLLYNTEAVRHRLVRTTLPPQKCVTTLACSTLLGREIIRHGLGIPIVATPKAPASKHTPTTTQRDTGRPIGTKAKQIRRASGCLSSLSFDFTTPRSSYHETSVNRDIDRDMSLSVSTYDCRRYIHVNL